MKKLLILIAFLIAITIFPKNVNAATESATVKPVVVSATLKSNISLANAPDKRAQALERVFEKYNSPLIPYAEYYVKSADTYGVDWKLLPAISGLESGFGRAMIDATYNPYGWGSGHIYFESWEDGIDTVNEGLSKRYYARGADTVWEIGPIYAESPTWAVRVNHFMSIIEAEYENKTDELPITI